MMRPAVVISFGLTGRLETVGVSQSRRKMKNSRKSKVVRSMRASFISTSGLCSTDSYRWGKSLVDTLRLSIERRTLSFTFSVAS